MLRLWLSICSSFLIGCDSFSVIKNDFHKRRTTNLLSLSSFVLTSTGSVGLLSGIEDIDNSLFYTNCLSRKYAHQLISSSDTFYENLPNKDKKNLEEIIQNAKIFIYSDRLWDRYDLNETLRMLTSTVEGGKFVCLLGGKNTGKSLILKTLDKSKVFIIKLRRNKNMMSALIDTLKERNILSQNKALSEKAFSLLTDKMGNIFDFQKFFDSFSGKLDTSTTLQEIIIELVKILGPITLIFDEANLALTIDDSTSEAHVNEVESVLALFTLLTKEEKKLNILLVSSEHSFPFKLSNPKLKFNLLDFTNYIFAGEVPPNEMYKLLRNEWKIESNFALKLIDIYGGHIWDIYQSLLQLKEEKNNFVFLNSDLTTSVQKCIDWQGEKPGDRDRMIKTLKSLAISGFVPLDRVDDPMAKAISVFGVGGVVRRQSKIIGLNSTVWHENKKFKYGIIPSKQSIRLAIAEYLIYEQE